MLDPGGGFSVQPETLVAASGDISRLADHISSFAGTFSGRTGSADAGLGAVGAGSGWTEFSSSWEAAFRRLANAVQTYAFNTEAAAVAYENADKQALPPPPPPPSPPQQNNGNNPCKPNILGQMPQQCYTA